MSLTLAYRAVQKGFGSAAVCSAPATWAIASTLPKVRAWEPAVVAAVAPLAAVRNCYLTERHWLLPPLACVAVYEGGLSKIAAEAAVAVDIARQKMVP